MPVCPAHPRARPSSWGPWGQQGWCSVTATSAECWPRRAGHRDRCDTGAVTPEGTSPSDVSMCRDLLQTCCACRGLGRTRNSRPPAGNPPSCLPGPRGSRHHPSRFGACTRPAQALRRRPLPHRPRTGCVASTSGIAAHNSAAPTGALALPVSRSVRPCKPPAHRGAWAWGSAGLGDHGRGQQIGDHSPTRDPKPEPLNH